MRNTLVALIDGYPDSFNSLARRAGVSPSTISRIRNGSLDPSLGVAGAIFNALGHQFPKAAPKLCNMEALAAARRMLDGGVALSEWGEILARWVGPDGGPIDLALEAGRAAPSEIRPSVRTIRTDWSAMRVLGAVEITGARWVVSGWPAALDPSAPMAETPFQLYVDGGYPALGLTLPDMTHGETLVHVLPFDGVSEADPWMEGGVPWASANQVLLDLFSDPRTEALGHDYFDLLERDTNE